MIARNHQYLETGGAQPGEVSRCLAKLIHARTLSQIAADDDKIRLLLLKPHLGSGHDFRVMCPEMEVREMRDTGHN